LLTSSSVLLMEEQVGDCGVDWHCSATLKDIEAWTPRGESTLKSTNIQRVWSCDLVPSIMPLLASELSHNPQHHGFHPRYAQEYACLKGIFLFNASVSPAEAARRFREHLSSCVDRVTLPKRSVAVPSSLIVVQASRCPVRSSGVATY
jgi:hypothetical protein